ncbi:MAG: RNA pyrophosphohydrolase [Alphaproteobacteria bacterium]|nr:RNA pyrophosphohydrolase [Alphaproteobacteria bacterium]
MLPYRKCVAIVLKKDNLIFVAERLDTKNAWQLPQGGVDSDESYLEAAKRELLEETGVSSVKFLTQTRNLYKYDFSQYSQDRMMKKYGALKYRGQELCFTMFEFTGNDSEVNLNYNTQEFCRWKWESVEGILNFIVDFKYKCYKAAFSELNLLR